MEQTHNFGENLRWLVCGSELKQMDENEKLSMIPVTEISSTILSSVLYSYSGKGWQLIGHVSNSKERDKSSTSF